MREEYEEFDKEVETIKTTKQILELKNTMTELQNSERASKKIQPCRRKNQFPRRQEIQNYSVRRAKRKNNEKEGRNLMGTIGHTHTHTLYILWNSKKRRRRERDRKYI